MSAKGLGGWVQKRTGVLMKFSTDIVGGSEKVQKCADVMYGRVQTSQGQPLAYDLISESMLEMIRWLTFGNV